MVDCLVEPALAADVATAATRKREHPGETQSVLTRPEDARDRKGE